MMLLFHDLAQALPVAAMKAVRVEETPWFVAMPPDFLAYALFAGLALIILYVFSR
jgi:hypothetical protein